MGFNYIDVSGDAGIVAEGKDLPELFESAALGMYSLITDPDKIMEKTDVRVEVVGQTMEGLLVSWLNELVFRFDAYGFVGRSMEFLEFGDLRLVSVVRGEEFDPGRHEKRLLVKAATYHNLEVKAVSGGWKAEVIFDI